MVLIRPSGKVTLRHLLTHTHGLEEPPAAAPLTSLAEIATAASRGPLGFEPGTRWRYGNAGMAVLGRIVEIVSETPFADHLSKRFFQPLGMNDTTFYPSDAQYARRALCYKRPEAWGPIEETGIGILNGDPATRTQSVMPGGGLFSTTHDIWRFYQTLANGGAIDGRRYLSESRTREMTTPQTGELEAGFSGGMAWGLGVGIVRSPQGWTDVLPVGTWGHDGAYGPTVMIEPRSGLLFMMMIQRVGLNPYSNGLRFRHAFHMSVREIYGF
jgi:CubicO group peptidase (beta-lactamase class C family)